MRISVRESPANSHTPCEVSGLHSSLGLGALFLVRPGSCGAWSPVLAFNVPSPPVMGVYRFEDLRVWQAAKQQCDQVGALLNRATFQRDRKLSDQMNDASLSVMFNISEGFLRRHDKETLQFLRYAFASNGELKSGFYAAEGRCYLSAPETAELIRLNESIAKMLRRWMQTVESRIESGRGSVRDFVCRAG